MTAQHTRVLERARLLGYLPPPMAGRVSKYAAKWHARAAVPLKAPRQRGPAFEIWPPDALEVAPIAHRAVRLRLVDTQGTIVGRRNSQSRKGASALLTPRQVRRILGWIDRGTAKEVTVGPIIVERERRNPERPARVIFRDSRRRVAVALPALAARLREALESLYRKDVDIAA